MHCTISDFFIFSNLNDLLFGAKRFLYKENERSTLADVVRAYLKYVISLLVKSSGISKQPTFSSSPLNIFEILQAICNPLFLLRTVCNFSLILIPIWPFKLLNLAETSSIFCIVYYRVLFLKTCYSCRKALKVWFYKSQVTFNLWGFKMLLSTPDWKRIIFIKTFNNIFNNLEVFTIINWSGNPCSPLCFNIGSGGRGIACH